MAKMGNPSKACMSNCSVHCKGACIATASSATRKLMHLVSVAQPGCRTAASRQGNDRVRAAYSPR